MWILGLFPPALWGSIPRGWGSLSIRSSPLCRSAFLLVLMVVAVDLSISHHSLSDHTPFQLFFYFEVPPSSSSSSSSRGQNPPP